MKKKLLFLSLIVFAIKPAQNYQVQIKADDDFTYLSQCLRTYSSDEAVQEMIKIINDQANQQISQKDEFLLARLTQSIYFDIKHNSQLLSRLPDFFKNNLTNLRDCVLFLLKKFVNNLDGSENAKNNQQELQVQHEQKVEHDEKEYKEKEYREFESLTSLSISDYELANSENVDSKFLVASKVTNRARIINLKNGATFKNIKANSHNSYVYSQALSRNRKYLAVGLTDRAKIFNTQTGELVVRVCHLGAADSVAFSHDNKLVAICFNNKNSSFSEFVKQRGFTDSVILVVNLETRAITFTVNANNLIRSCSFNSDNKLRVLTDDNVLSAINLSESKVESKIDLKFFGLNHNIMTAFSPDDRLLAIVNNTERKIIIYDIVQEKVVHEIIVLGWISSIEFSPDSKYLATSGIYDSTTIYSVNSGKISRHFKRIGSLFFSDDCKTLLIDGIKTQLVLLDSYFNDLNPEQIKFLNNLKAKVLSKEELIIVYEKDKVIFDSLPELLRNSLQQNINNLVLI